MNIQVDGQMDGYMGGQREGWMDGYREGWVHGLIGRMDRQMDKQINRGQGALEEENLAYGQHDGNRKRRGFHGGGLVFPQGHLREQPGERGDWSSHWGRRSHCDLRHFLLSWSCCLYSQRHAFPVT